MKKYLNALKKDLPSHAMSFWLPWVLLTLMLVISCINLPSKPYLLLGLVVVFVIVLILKPMNIIYGLIGTHGYIGLFFLLFFVINFGFSGIYYYAFFHDAGITYETNQPHVEFALFHNIKEAEMIPEKSEENLPQTSKDSPHTYYKTTYNWVLRNTFLTSLMQEPTDFFSATNTFTGVTQSSKDPNYTISKTFHWYLIFHIMISWILLGVFISLVYQKFRNS